MALSREGVNLRRSRPFFPSKFLTITRQYHNIPVSVLRDRLTQRLEDHNCDRIAPLVKVPSHLQMTQGLLPYHLDAIGLFVLGPLNGL